MLTTLRFNAYTEDEVRSLEAALRKSKDFIRKDDNLVHQYKPSYEVGFMRRTLVLLCDQSCLECVTAHFKGILRQEFAHKSFMIH